MSLREKLGLKLLHQLDPERAHGLSIQALQLGLAPLHGGPVQRARLETSMGGIALHNPVGLAAGYDKNAEALAPMAKAGFGFLEVGAATPQATARQSQATAVSSDQRPGGHQPLWLQQSRHRRNRHPSRAKPNSHTTRFESWCQQRQRRPSR